MGKQDLGTSASSIDVAAAGYTAAGSDAMSGAANTGAIALASNATPVTTLAIVGQTAGTGTTSVAAGTGFTATITAGSGIFATGMNTTTTAGNQEIVYVARDGDTEADVAQGLVDAFNSYISENDIAVAAGISASVDSTNANQINVTGPDASQGTGAITVQFQTAATADTTIGGRLEKLAEIDVTTQAGVDSALTDIEALLQTAIDSASSFGSVQGRIETQSSFISSLTDSLKSGIGTLVDADMEEASARLQALQVQQQLGIQALSIANQAPQQLLSLFR